MIGIVDYGMGNLRSVQNALDYVGAPGRLVKTPDEAAETEKLILPGVGAFGAGMQSLDRLGFAEALPQLVAAGRPLLGICLGMQLLADSSTEHGEHPGLGIIPGRVERIIANPPLRVPHVGWNVLSIRRRTELFEHLGDDATFYFVHSYVFRTHNNERTTAVAEYGGPLTACVEDGNVVGVQFHPEKSQADGLTLLRNFAQAEAC